MSELDAEDDAGSKSEQTAAVQDDVGGVRATAEADVDANGVMQDVVLGASDAAAEDTVAEEKDDKSTEDDGQKAVADNAAAGDREMMGNLQLNIAPAASADGSVGGANDSMVQKGMTEMGHLNGVRDDGLKKGKRRRLYQTDEERRMARIMKNRRTAEESRQRRLQRLKQLEDMTSTAAEREKNMRWEVSQLREDVALRAAEVKRLSEEVEKLRQENASLKNSTESATDKTPTGTAAPAAASADVTTNVSAATQ